MFCVSLLLLSIELLSPVKDAPVRLLPDAQRGVLALESLPERESFLSELRRPDDDGRAESPWRKSAHTCFRWRATEGEKGPWELLLSKNPDLSDARQFVFQLEKADAASGRAASPSEAAGALSYEPPYLNLEIGTRYYWRVTSDLTCGKFAHGRVCPCRNRRAMTVSEIGSFVTEDLAPRWIAIEGRVGNFRDLGGRRGRDGRRVRQGLVYRSRGLNDNSVDGIARGKNRLTVSDVEYLTQTLAIRTDLDLRTPAEVAGLAGVSPLGPDVRYVNRSSPCYDGIFSADGRRTMASNFREFLDRKNYPILFHCIGGADRTGALAYVLNGVLGVCRRETETDWESTFYPNVPCRDKSGRLVWNSELHFNEGFGRYGDEKTPWNDRIVLYLKDCGVTDDEIESFRAIMLQ